jgi:diguanylate cyclase (GGDEF)-like protein/PAS domain S-box-containing protein
MTIHRLDNNERAGGIRRLIEADLVSVVIADLEGVVTSCDDLFLKMLGYDKNDEVNLRSITPSEFQWLDDEALEKLTAFGSCPPFEKQFTRKDGTRVPVLFSAAVSTKKSNELTCFIADLSQSKQSLERLNHLAYHDAVTGLPNQVLFKDRLKQAIAMSRRNDQKQAVLLLNLDRFKTINDSLGYIAGDRVLQSVAERLTSCVRDSDTVARFGGDEFAILLAQINRHQDAANTARALKDVLAQPFIFDDQELFVTSSIGISLFPYDGQDTPSLLKTAGMALNRAKEQGGNNFQFYTSGGTTSALKQLVLESNMRPGLERREFFVAYQPQVDINDFRLVGMEALARWNHPTLGILLPTEFIPIAEDSGLIIAIGDGVMRDACRQNKKWQDAGLEPMRLSVNFSARQFQQPTFIPTVVDVLKETGLEPAWLELELTEGSIMKDPEQAIEKLRELRSMGIKIAIDDFGTGYSSLSYLKRFPIDTLKIDKSFVQDLCTDPDDASIVKAIVTLGHAMDLKVVAEGVETQEQLEYLTLLGCDILQGFLFSEPLTSLDFFELLVAQSEVLAARSSYKRDRTTNPLKPVTGVLSS